MFGIYSNQRISDAETKLLNQNPDDYIWYGVYLTTIFKDPRFFQIRQDIKLPQDDGDNGVVLLFQDGDVVYFKTLDNDPTNEDGKAIVEVCSYLENLFKRPVKAYIVCPPNMEVDVDKLDFEGEGDITINFSSLKTDNGEEIIDRLERKLKKGEEFTIPDSIDHMLLPYTGFKNKDVFDKKFKRYMELVNEYGGKINVK